MVKKKLVVVGAGASGLMAAGKAAVEGADVNLIEKMNQPGKKLGITGKGRCNITNISGIRDFIEHFGENGKFLRQAFSFFFNTELIDFFSELGVPSVSERGGRVFPATNNAADIVTALTGWNKKSGVLINTSVKAGKLIIENNRVKGLMATSSREKSRQKHTIEKIIEADAVIIATGGASYPGTGSTGDGYILAESAGHHITPVRPALVPIETEGDVATRLEGLSLKNINVSVWINDRKLTEKFGEMIFTGTGLSGPVILTLSKICVDAINSGNRVMLSIDLKPALDHKALDQRLIRDIGNSSAKSVKNMLKGLLPERLVTICAEEVNLDPDKKANQLTSSERKKLRLWLKDFRFEASGYRPLNEAIITAGGVDIKQIDPRTMESRIIKGLYFAGEVIDVDADTGGYNLQAAFSTGWLAGKSAAAG